MEDYMKGMSIDNVFIIGASIGRTAEPSVNSTDSTVNVAVESNTTVDEITTEPVEGEATDMAVDGEATGEADASVEGEQNAESGEAAVDGEGIDAGVNEEELTEDFSGSDMGIDPVMDGGIGIPGMEGGGYDETMGMGLETVKDPLLASWPAVIGISGAVLLVSLVLGALLAKRKIKKGIDLYED